MANGLDRTDAIDGDLTKLRSKLPADGGIRDLVQHEDGKLGALGRMLAICRVLQARRRLSAKKIAHELWNALPEEKRATFDVDQDDFINRTTRLLQPSQSPHGKLNKAQAVAMEAAAAAIAERTLEEDPANTRRALSRSYNNGRALVSTLSGSKSIDLPTKKYIDPKFLQERQLYDQHEEMANTVYRMYLTEPRKRSDILCIVGEPYSGKKTILSYLIKRYIEEAEHLPVFALACGGLTYTEVGAKVTAFLEEASAVFGEQAEDKLKLTRERASSHPAVYILADLEVLSGDPARRLIRQEDLIELIDVLLRGNLRTRVIISCEHVQQGTSEGGSVLRPGSPSGISWLSLGNGWVEAVVLGLAPPTTRTLIHALERVLGKDSLAGLRYRPDPINGAALDLCLTYARLCTNNGASEKAINDIKALLTSGQDEINVSLSPDLILGKVWQVLMPLQRQLCTIIAASDDGVRESSLCWILDHLRHTSEDKRTAILHELHELHHAFGEALRSETSGQSWKLDDLPGEQLRGPLYEFDRSIRRAILSQVEGEGSTEAEHTLARRVHRLIAAKAREQAHHRRLNVPGMYGARLLDLSRDIQAVLSLVGSVNLEGEKLATSPANLAPLEIERAIFQGSADDRTALRFAYLQMWRHDIDRNYRLNTEHAADELRLHVLLAIATSRGKSFFPPKGYKVTEGDFETLHDKVFNDIEIPEFLTTLAISGQQSGAFEIVAAAAAYAEKHLKADRPDKLILKTKLQRALIDTQMLDGRDPPFPVIEQNIQNLIRSIPNDLGAAGDEARLKLYLRLGDVCYLQGNEAVGEGRTKFHEAQEAFERAVSLEKKIRTSESHMERRSLISGHGARRFLRASLEWALEEAQKDNQELADKFLNQARNIHTVSLRRLSRHTADRAGILLDEARLHFVEGRIQQHQNRELNDSARKAYHTAKYLIERAHDFVIQPGLPIAIKLDLDGLAVRIGTQLATAYENEDRTALLRLCDSSAKRLRRVADRYHLSAYRAYSRLLMFTLAEVRDKDRAYEDSDLIGDLQEARNICEAIGLYRYRDEIDKRLNALAPHR